MMRETCGGCGGGRVRLVLDLGDSPLADEFPSSINEAQLQPRYPLGLQHCPDCTMVQLSYVVPDSILWGGDYGFYTGASAQATAYFQDYARDVLARYPRAARRGVCEIAANDGTLLKHFADAGMPALGIDPAAGPVSVAQGRGLKMVHAVFSREMVAQHQMKAGLIIANNVIAHVADLDDFVGGIADMLHPEGVAIVEFQYLIDMIVGNAFDHVYHEHRSFLSLTALQNVLIRHGLVAVTAEHTEQQRGSLRVSIEHAGPDVWPDQSVRKIVRSEDWLTHPHALSGLQGIADRIRTLLVEALGVQRLRGAKVAGYGASAKAATLLNWCGIDADLVSYVVDTTPSKWGRYIPGTAIPIISPTADSRQPDVYLLLISNYLPHVLRKESTFAEHGGRWLVPVPYPVMI